MALLAAESLNLADREALHSNTRQRLLDLVELTSRADSQYHTYSWGHLHAADPLFEQRVREAVDQALQAKGLREVRQTQAVLKKLWRGLPELEGGIA